jgi:pyridoxal 5'-phosphate synthase pdxT subunit
MEGELPPVGLKVGVLALQGAFREHVRVLESLGARAHEVRLPRDLVGLDGLIIPGGESTTMGKLMEEYGLTAPLRRFVAERPVFGTCAGLIMLAARTTEGDQPLLAALDVTVRRNAFGRQVHSFEAPVELTLSDGRVDVVPGVFIRAPWVESWADTIEVVARFEGHVVGVRQGHLLGVAFHPELTADCSLHSYFLGGVARHRALVC